VAEVCNPLYVYLLALHELTCLTKVKKLYRPTGSGLLPPPGQVGITDLQEEKGQEKENGRKQVLASMVPSPGADTNWVTVALQEKSKQSAVTTMMQQVHNQYQSNIATKTAEAKTMHASKKRKAKPKKAKE
jgi:hypothetical protein